MTAPKKKVIAKATNAGKANNTKDSLVLCEVKLENGEWVSPSSCQIFYIDEDANFPDITYEIKTDLSGTFEWSWEIKWTGLACPQAEGKKRYSSKKEKTFSKSGTFDSADKKWKADLGAVIGGDLTVKVKVRTTTFVRKTLIRGKSPSKEKIVAGIDSYTDADNKNMIKKIFQQESRYRHFYSDEMPLTSFDNGYGLGQLTNEPPTYEQIWNWKAHVKELMEKRLPAHRKRAKKYLDAHGNYTTDQLDMETLAAYNGWAGGQHYWNWDALQKTWAVNDNVTCDPDQSNKGWLVSNPANKGKTLEELKKNKDAKPNYTGRCYAEHIKSTQH